MAAGRCRRSVDDGSDHTSGETVSPCDFFKLLPPRLAFLSMNLAMAQERIRISSDWGNVTAELADNDATRSLVRMLPLTIEMRDHLRQEKTGNLPSPLPEVARQLDFCGRDTGALGPGSLRDLLPRRPCASAGDHPARPSGGRRLDLRSARSRHRPNRARQMRFFRWPSSAKRPVGDLTRRAMCSEDSPSAKVPWNSGCTACLARDAPVSP